LPLQVSDIRLNIAITSTPSTDAQTWKKSG